MSERISESEAFTLMRKSGLEPQEPYPVLHKPWKSECSNCKRIHSWAYSRLYCYVAILETGGKTANYINFYTIKLAKSLTE